MLSSAFQYWRRALQQSATWSAVVWTLVFVLLLVVAMAAIGAGTFLSAMYHPGLTGVAPQLAPGKVLSAMVVMYLVMLVAGPFLGAGIYGLFGRAVNGEPIAWSSFWRLAIQFYGRSWGLILFSLLWLRLRMSALGF